jgi:hypothetical protein
VVVSRFRGARNGGVGRSAPNKAETRGEQEETSAEQVDREERVVNWAIRQNLECEKNVTILMISTTLDDFPGNLVILRARQGHQMMTLDKENGTDVERRGQKTRAGHAERCR